MIDSQTLKTQLTEFTLVQKSCFTEKNIMALLTQRSDFYDSLLLDLWHQIGFADRQDLALIAVGGYGRKEMFPLSDLDILVLSEQPLDEQSQSQLNAMFNLLWDSKLQLGTSIRTIAECLEIGRAEISVATNMLESRFLTGNERLWQQLISQLFHADFWAIQHFFAAKIAEKTERYARYHNTSYNLEPDLKHSPGGLRDLHLLSWIMLRHYGLHSLDDLFEKGLLYPEEFLELQQAQRTLFRMRFALHLQLKRYDNRLRFDRQLQLSEQLGYQGEGNQPVEAMMKDFFQATQSISVLTQLLLDHFEQTVLSPLQKNGQKQPLDPYFYLQNNTLICSNPLIFKQQPERILDLFFHLTEHAQSVAETTTLRQLRLALQSLSRPLCEIPQARSRFIQLFSQPDVVKRAIVPMHQLGVLTAYIPQWKGIQGLMQFDLFHIYTVDEHTIRVMLKLESFLQIENAGQHPLCCHIFPTLPKRPLLYLAALFHDIAKGREGEHATVGAVDMRLFAEQHGFNQEETDYMAWLVAEHLTMSITAQRRDIHDPDVVKTFAKIVNNPTALSALTCLTVADICATNESLWNDWKRSLFMKLYQFTEQQLQLGDEQALDHQKLSQDHRQAAFSQLTQVIAEEQHALLAQFWQGCPESYFVRNSPTQLYWHALHYLKYPQLPMVLISNQYARGATEIFIHCADQMQLFARIAQTLSQKKVSIHDAQIITSENGFVLDSFIITEMNGQPLDNERSEQIRTALLNTLTVGMNKAFSPNKKPVKHQSFKRKTKIRFLANSQPNQTAFELFTLDREGLLAQIGYIFSELHLNLLNAKITTIGERVEDFFVVSNQQDTALSDEEQRMLKQRLMTLLE
ncbi:MULTISPECIES: bifunctional uridylyltransferase/uridylyl-removing protein GlnD [Glaesserella]|uniref:Bifunctional uridylyltransferase/uridylyl-removing enzyme n=1 Tax=Glaesserella australis TaxID=2094024 RepID=A0A328C197_9PAST|nr:MULTISPECIES: bifunctional uridylyltransferase/uridylyl-removing protein GlnD [Glaesserella]AUI65497.1 [protein-PII] uridylyltransferase [Glaesserella sp. 15-184]RAL19695.1 [protein-PII] uridylyltransferase [Glaesserella australis]